MDKQQRNEKILRTLDTGALTLQEVADIYGVTRQRVHQIYQQERGQSYEPTRQAFKHAHPSLCQHCSKPAKSLGLCKVHYQNHRYHTIPEVRKKQDQKNRQWRRAHLEKWQAYNRINSRRYYWAHRDEILARERAKRREQRDEITATERRLSPEKTQPQRSWRRIFKAVTKRG